MKSTTRMCFVRHGETAWNADSRIQGHLDVALNPTGQWQAASAARALAGQAFDMAYSSDLCRAADTARAIVGQRNISLVLREALRERHYGDFQGRTYAESKQLFAPAYAQFESRDPAFAFPGGGESLLAFAARVQTVFDDIARDNTGQTVLVATHGGVLDVLYRYCQQLPLQTQRDFDLKNATLNWVTHCAQDGWRIECWGDDAHLDAGAKDELANA